MNMYIRKSDLETLAEVESMIHGAMEALEDESVISYWRDFSDRFTDFKRRAKASHSYSAIKGKVLARAKEVASTVPH